MRHLGQLDLAPAYALSDAAFYLRLPRQTVGRWTEALGSKQDVELGGRAYSALSYATLLELHVLKAMRLKHEVPLQRIRRALNFLKQQFPTAHPLLDREFSTNGLDLFFEYNGDLINASRGGQSAIRDVVDVYLSRIEWQGGRNPVFYPFVAEEIAAEPKIIEIRPNVAFGRPVIAGTGIAADVIVGRFLARESPLDLAEEYGVTPEMIFEAVRWEMPHRDAA